ncbi:hypothetical protein [Lacipirellula parvula]|uniref:Uncharacterized protein n=1 Tax=Lacipirellula parvula TaxID=2650471 RepID=A0A5K7XLA2_9BACT|nr:hypothetical protein [Lacipirellula parvula]BBO36061.1 hypothetical protein PLANPX_5673 [Lacipirellula parvula]
MMIRWYFLHGPLDGLSLECDSEEISDCPLNLAAHAYRESLNGFPGATFDAFWPPELLALAGRIEATQRLHSYRVVAARRYEVAAASGLAPVLCEIRAKYEGVTDRLVAYQVDRQAGGVAVKIRRQWNSAAPPQLPDVP